VRTGIFRGGRREARSDAATAVDKTSETAREDVARRHHGRLDEGFEPIR